GEILVAQPPQEQTPPRRYEGCTVAGHRFFIEADDFTGCGVNFCDSAIFFRIGTRTTHTLPAFRLAAVIRAATTASASTVASRLSGGLTALAVRVSRRRGRASHIEAIIDVRNVEGVLCRVVCHWPIALCVVRADHVMFSGFLQDEIPVDRRLSGFHIDIGYQEIRLGIWKGIGP